MAVFILNVIKDCSYNIHCNRLNVCIDCLISVVAEHNCDSNILNLTKFISVTDGIYTSENHKQLNITFVPAKKLIFKMENWEFVVGQIAKKIGTEFDNYLVELIPSYKNWSNKTQFPTIYWVITEICNRELYLEYKNTLNIPNSNVEHRNFPIELLKMIIKNI